MTGAALLAGLAIYPVIPLHAFGDKTSVNSAQFLRLGAGARALGMAEAFTAVSDDSSAVYWNPSGLARIRHPEAAYTHTELLGDFRYEFLSVAYPAEKLRGALGLGFTFLTQDAIQSVTKEGDPGGESFSPQSLAAAFAYGARLELASHPLAVGGAFKIIRETLYRHSASAVALDLGAILTPAHLTRLRLAATLRNLGAKMKFIREQESLPSELDIGIAYSLPHSGRSAVGSAELALPYYGTPFAKFGLEYGGPLSERIHWSMRAGYKTLTASDLGALTGLTFGAGLRFGKIQTDMAFQPAGNLGAVYRFSLGYRFGETGRIQTTASGSSAVQEISPEPASAFQGMDPREVKRLMEQGRPFELIDVRPLQEYSRLHLVGARNVPFYEIATASLPTDRPLVLYCSQASCSLSPESALALSKRGYRQIHVLDGGIEGAMAQGLPVESQSAAPPSPTCSLSRNELQRLLGLSEKPVVVDLRPENEYNAGHIPGSRNVPLERLETAAADLYKYSRLVLYDRIPERFQRGALMLQNAAPQVCVLEGGMIPWSAEGRPVQTLPY